MPKLAPSTPEQWAAYKGTHHVSPFDNYSLIHFVTDIQGLINSKEQYIAVIKRMEDKINREYPALIALKEAEKAAAEKEANEFRDANRKLVKKVEEQTTEIQNLKKHPKFSGFVKASDIRKRDG
jgi:hypothetical protein